MFHSPLPVVRSCQFAWWSSGLCKEAFKVLHLCPTLFRNMLFHKWGGCKKAAAVALDGYTRLGLALCLPSHLNGQKCDNPRLLDPCIDLSLHCEPLWVHCKSLYKPLALCLLKSMEALVHQKARSARLCFQLGSWAKPP